MDSFVICAPFRYSQWNMNSDILRYSSHGIAPMAIMDPCVASLIRRYKISPFGTEVISDSCNFATSQDSS
jgi:hypothetical protein